VDGIRENFQCFPSYFPGEATFGLGALPTPRQTA
jgi:hypothetical protein